MRLVELLTINRAVSGQELASGGASYSWTRDLPVLYPFAAAIVLWILSPWFTEVAKILVLGQIDRALNAIKNPPEYIIPPALSKDMIGDYIEYASDAVQIVVAVLLPAFGALLVMADKVSTTTAPLAIFVVVIVMVILILWVFKGSAADYASRKFFGYSLVSVAGILVNVLAVAAVIVIDSRVAR